MLKLNKEIALRSQVITTNENGIVREYTSVRKITENF